MALDAGTPSSTRSTVFRHGSPEMTATRSRADPLSVIYCLVARSLVPTSPGVARP